jgi:phospholipid transport system substrate-binding protein
VRNADAEAYVQENAAAALRTLGDRNVSAAQRQQTFNQLMARFADMPRIANFVLGRYGVQLRSDAALRSEWTRAFQEYAIAVYEAQLDRYNGGIVRVTGSVERTPGRDVIVSSQITPRGASRALPVQWRLLRSGAVWKVVDVSLLIDGNEIWMAQQQQRDFLAALDRNSGDIRALMVQIRGQTSAMRDRALTRT